MSVSGGPGSEGGPGTRARELTDAAWRALDEGRPDAALPLLEKAADLTPNVAVVHVGLGRALNNLRRLPAARDAFEEAVRLDPKSAMAWNGLGHVCRALGDMDTAREAFRCAVSLEPGSGRTIANLASVHLARGEFEEGLRTLHRAAAADPSNPRTPCLLGDALQSAGRYLEAEKAYADALAIEPGHPDALAGMGTVMDALGRHAEAERLLRDALSRRPGDPVAAASLVHVLELQGRGMDVLEVIQDCRWSRPPGWAIVAEARQLVALDRPEEAEARLCDLEAEATDPPVRTASLFLRARILDERGEFEAAFRMLQAANDSQPPDFDPEAFRDAVDRLIEFFTPARLAQLPRSGCESEQPVFVIGMPRSGTTLVEQILGAHSRVLACGERTDFYGLPRRLSGGQAARRWPACLADMEPERLFRAATDYLDAKGETGADILRMTDKLPANFLNLGLVQLLFPRARVIYCRRDPMDTGLSCFGQDFRSPGMGFARSLAFIGVYQQGCSRLMEHWGSVLDLALHAVDYEELVASPEREARAMVEFLGLQWEDACLRFHEAAGVVRTASHRQVRRPVYTSSVGRWRHYREWLGPLREALDAPWREATGRSGH